MSGGNVTSECFDLVSPSWKYFRPLGCTEEEIFNEGPKFEYHMSRVSCSLDLGPLPPLFLLPLSGLKVACHVNWRRRISGHSARRGAAHSHWDRLHACGNKRLTGTLCNCHRRLSSN